MKRIATLTVAAMALFASTGAQAQMKDIVDTAVAAGKYLAVLAQALHHAFGRRRNRRRQRIHALQLQMGAFRKIFTDAVYQIHLVDSSDREIIAQFIRRTRF